MCNDIDGVILAGSDFLGWVMTPLTPPQITRLLERHVRCTLGDTPVDEHRCEADSRVSRLL